MMFVYAGGSKQKCQYQFQRDRSQIDGNGQICINKSNQRDFICTIKKEMVLP